jgi:hypothetical protein
MNLRRDKISESTDHTLTFARYIRFFEGLTALYADMDRAYAETSAYYGFQCAGCTDNCCLTLFYHYTHIERLYLLSGFFKLDAALQDEIRNRAQKVNRLTLAAQSQGSAPKVMCALNEKGACMLYAYRPMICRLHGIPHELRPPGKAPILSPGCAEFVLRHGGRGYREFDRTPFYLSLAGLEQRFKEASCFSGKIKKTVSEFFL